MRNSQHTSPKTSRRGRFAPTSPDSVAAAGVSQRQTRRSMSDAVLMRSVSRQPFLRTEKELIMNSRSNAGFLLLCALGRAPSVRPSSSRIGFRVRRTGAGSATREQTVLDPHTLNLNPAIETLGGQTPRAFIYSLST